jgi:hypothetical protein
MPYRTGTGRVLDGLSPPANEIFSSLFGIRDNACPFSIEWAASGDHLRTANRFPHFSRIREWTFTALVLSADETWQKSSPFARAPSFRSGTMANNHSKLFEIIHSARLDVWQACQPDSANLVAWP